MNKKKTDKKLAVEQFRDESYQIEFLKEVTTDCLDSFFYQGAILTVSKDDLTIKLITDKPRVIWKKEGKVIDEERMLELIDIDSIENDRQLHDYVGAGFNKPFDRYEQIRFFLTDHQKGLETKDYNIVNADIDEAIKKEKKDIDQYLVKSR